MKKINLRIEDNVWTLEYNRETAVMMEKQGFKADEAGSCPATMIPILYRGAFKKNHGYLKNIRIDEIWGKVKGKQKLIENLVEMYVEAVSVDLTDDEDFREGNENWEVVE